MTDSFSGSCVCGAVRYRAQPPQLVFQYCHCTRCRKATGSAHAANLFVRADNFSWEEGEEHVRRFELPDAKYWCNGFCDICGSTLPWLSRNGRTFIIPAGTLDDDPGAVPTQNIYFGSRANWYQHAADLAIHDELPPR